MKGKNRERNRRYHEKHREEIAERNRKWRQENPERSRELQRQWKENNRERIRQNDRKRLQENPEKVLEKNRRGAKKAANELVDSYVRRKLIANDHFRKEDVTPELIELKRALLLLKRLLKERK